MIKSIAKTIFKRRIESKKPLLLELQCVIMKNIIGKRRNMHFNLWFNDTLVAGIQKIMEATGKKRNTVIKEAVEKYINDWDGFSWPEEIKKFKGIEGFSEEDRFENVRNGLKKSEGNLLEDR